MATLFERYEEAAAKRDAVLQDVIDSCINRAPKLADAPRQLQVDAAFSTGTPALREAELDARAAWDAWQREEGLY